MPNFNGVWSLTTQLQYASAWPVPPAAVGIFAGGFDSSATVDVIQEINIYSAGNATDFGNLSAAKMEMASVASSTRGVFGGG